MSTPAIARASHRPAEVPIDVDGLVVEIERYLASRARTTAHPLVTRSTQELVAEALRGLEPAPAAATGHELRAPSAFLKHLPHWALRFPLIRRHYGAGRPITAAEHLELTALVLERWGWAQSDDRTTGGAVCIRGAQFVLLRLGYGDADTLHRATAHLHQALAPAGGGDFVGFNDTPGRTRAQVLALLRTAAAGARASRG